MYELFKKFLSEKVADFRRMVRKAKGEVALEDLQNDAWIVATELGDKRNVEIDFADRDDQDWVLPTLYNRSVRGSEKTVRYALRIDEKREGEEDTPSLAERLPAPASSDPLTALLDREAQKQALVIIDESLAATFSQAAAYAISLERFVDIESLGIFLAITKATLSQRISRAALSLSVQESLFDGIERISTSFMPRRGIVFLISEKLDPVPSQLALPLADLVEI